MLTSRIWLPLAILLCIFAAAACGQADTIQAEGGSQLTWPPDETLARAASDDAPFFRGKEFSSAGGGKTQLSGSGVILGPNQKPSWAIYSLQGFGADVALDKVVIDYVLTLGSPDQNTKLYFGIANYSTDTWEWIDVPDGSPATIDLADFSSYYSPSGSVHIACILSGNGYARISSLRFYRTGSAATIPVPDNLVPNPVPGAVQLAWDASPHVDGYNIYRNTVDDFATAARRNPMTVTAAVYNDNTVVKNSDYFYWVTAIRLTEGAPSSSVLAHTVDTTVATPQNFHGTAGVASAHLAWDPVSNALGYKLYRSRYSDFSTEEETPVAGTSYDDNGLPDVEEVYYYRVMAVGAVEESLKSPGIDMFIPNADLPAPTNFHVDTAHSDGDFVTFTWDYDEDPTFFNIYVHRKPNFPLDQSLIAPTTIVSGTKRKAIRFELPAEGGTYYARICALDESARKGFMTDSISFENHPYIVFAPQVEIAPSAGAPLAATTGDGELAVAYMSGTAVKLASMTGGSWSADEVLGLNSNFGTYLDIAYGGGKYCIGAWQTAAGDAWVSVGNHGSWGATRIDGDGSGGPGHTASGKNIAVAASDSEFSVTHLDEATSSVIVQSRANSGGAWSRKDALPLVAPYTDLSLAYQSGELELCVSDYDGGNLLLGTRSSNYSMSPVNVLPGDLVCQYNDLNLLDGNFLTPSLDQDTSTIYAYGYNGTQWQRDLVYSPTSTVTHLAMVTHADKALMTYLCPPQSRWYCAYFDGTGWSNSTVVTLGGHTIKDDARPMFLPTGEPYLVFIDESDALQGAIGNLL
jgi:hypothetical protein